MSWRSVRVDLQAITVTTSLARISGASLCTTRIDSPRRVSSQRLTTETLSLKLDTSDGVTQLVAYSSAEFNSVARICVGRILERLNAFHIVRPAALVCHVTSIGRKGGIGSDVQSRVGEGVITSLLAWVAKVKGHGTVAVKVVEEKTCLTGRRSKHSTTIVTGIDIIDSVTLTGR